MNTFPIYLPMQQTNFRLIISTHWNNLNLFNYSCIHAASFRVECRSWVQIHSLDVPDISLASVCGIFRRYSTQWFLYQLQRVPASGTSAQGIPMIFMHPDDSKTCRRRIYQWLLSSNSKVLQNNMAVKP